MRYFDNFAELIYDLLTVCQSRDITIRRELHGLEIEIVGNDYGFIVTYFNDGRTEAEVDDGRSYCEDAMKGVDKEIERLLLVHVPGYTEYSTEEK
jgi:hypothetical protein